MSFDSSGYPIIFIQKCPCLDQSAHQYSLIYKFFSPITQHHYIVNADYPDGDFFGIKFYCKRQRKSEHKYHKIVNKGDVANILASCIKVIPTILTNYPNASFGFVATRSYEKKSGRLESFSNNQRFILYKAFIARKVGMQTFDHIEYTHISAYLLLNKRSTDPIQKEKELREMLADTYSGIHNLDEA